MSKILIVGGSKFIGKTILQKLDKQAHDITVINRGTIENDKYLPEDVTHKIVDRNEIGQLKEAIAGIKFDIVYDICAVTRDHVSKLLEVIEGNVKRHVHVSSGSVYDMENVFSLPVDEDHPYPELNNETHPYVRAKTEAELELFKAYDRGYPVTMVRPTYVYGPDNYIYREAYFFDRISRERSILIPENGNGFFDMIHVDDLADITINLGIADNVIGKAFNGSSGKMISANMYAKLVAKILNKKLDIVYYTYDMLKELNWPEELYIYPYLPIGAFTMSTLKVYKELGFEHKFNYETGLVSTYEWWSKQDNPEPDWKREDLLIKYIKSLNDKDADKDLVKNELLLEIDNINKEIEKSRSV